MNLLVDLSLPFQAQTTTGQNSQLVTENKMQSQRKPFSPALQQSRTMNAWRDNLNVVLPIIRAIVKLFLIC